MKRRARISWKERAKITRSIPVSSMLTFLGGAACLFAAVGSLNDCLHLETSTFWGFVRAVLISAISGAGWAWFGSRRMFKSLIALGALSFIVFTAIGRMPPPPSRHLTAEQWQTGIAQHVAFAICMMYLSYILFVAFFRMEGRRLFAVQNEMELAAAIQRKLVPELNVQAGAFECYGISRPSGAVGGDLFDIVQTHGAVCAYLADVSGHGVPAGVLMSMVKTAVRTCLVKNGDRGDNLLGTLNEVLAPLTDSHSYATFAYVLGEESRPVKFSLAGHSAPFHLNRKTATITRPLVENFPLAMFPAATFETSEFAVDPGDLIALVTDGLTEIFDRQDNELGSDYIAKILLESADRPLAAIAANIFEAAQKFGTVTDDRTLLLLRRNSSLESART